VNQYRSCIFYFIMYATYVQESTVLLKRNDLETSKNSHVLSTFITQIVRWLVFRPIYEPETPKSSYKPIHLPAETPAAVYVDYTHYRRVTQTAEIMQRIYCGRQIFVVRYNSFEPHGTKIAVPSPTSRWSQYVPPKRRYLPN
jgi:hypothetical protein